VWIETAVTIQPNLLKIWISHSLLAVANEQRHWLAIRKTKKERKRPAVGWEIFSNEFDFVGRENLLL